MGLVDPGGRAFYKLGVQINAATSSRWEAQSAYFDSTGIPWVDLDGHHHPDLGMALLRYDVSGWVFWSL